MLGVHREFWHWQSPNPAHPHQVQPNLGAGGSFKAFTGEVAKIEKKGRLLHSWRNGSRIGKKTGIFLSSSHLPSSLSQIPRNWCLFATQKCTKPSSKKTCLKVNIIHHLCFLFPTPNQNSGGKNEGNVKKTNKQPQIETFKRQECQTLREI